MEEYCKKGIIRGYVSVETCLRIELYMDVSEDFHIEMIQRDFNSRNDKSYRGNEAVNYFLKVICGLDSVIKGEDQILVQLKKAYMENLEAGRTSSLLNIIFNNGIETGKKFRSESRINERNVSLDSIAVKFIKSKVETLEDKNIFIIGVGDLSRSILALLHKSEKCRLVMTNRSFRKSVELQKMFEGVQTADFHQKYEFVGNSDIIISATSAPHLVLEKERMRDILADGRKRLFLDLAVPRDIESGIGESENAELYHLEDIWDEYNKNIEKRDKIVEKYSYIINEQINKLFDKIERGNRYRMKRTEREGINGIQ